MVNGAIRKAALSRELSRQKSLATRVITDTTKSTDPVEGFVNTETMRRIDALFRKLDRNGNGVLDKSDFDLGVFYTHKRQAAMDRLWAWCEEFDKVKKVRPPTAAPC
jgi:hypothetical protein